MKTIIMDMNKWRMCCCCYIMHMMNCGKELRTNNINKYKKRQKHEENNIYNSIDFRAAA